MTDGDSRLSPLFTWRSAITDHDNGLSSTSRLVGLALSLYMNEKAASAFPGAERLARDTALNVRTVREHLALLVQLGWLSLASKGGQRGDRRHANNYVASIPNGGACVTGESPSPVTETARPVVLPAVTGEPGPPQSVMNSPQEGVSGAKPRKKATPAPEAFRVSDAVRQWALANNISADLDAEAEHFLDHHRAKGSRWVDWDASFRAWLRNSEKWAKEREPKNKPQHRVMRDRSRPSGRVEL